MLALTVKENQIIEIGDVKIFYRRLKDSSASKVRIYIDAPKEGNKITRTEAASSYNVSRNVRPQKSCPPGEA